jgi:hypothetical protein
LYFLPDPFEHHRSLERLWLAPRDFIYLGGIVGLEYPLMKKALTLTANMFLIIAAVLIVLDTILIYPGKAAFHREEILTKWR